jgi:hypothetical protein
MILVGALALLTFGAAAVGLHGAPTSDQIALQTAVEQTSEAPSFDYSIDTQMESVAPRRPISVQIHGIWRAPNQWQTTNVRNAPVSTTTIVGSTLQVSYKGSPSLDVRLSLRGLSESMMDPSSPVLSLPPLGLLLGATSVTRAGAKYSFVVPVLNIGVSGWIAYAPLSHATYPLDLTQAFNTRGEAIIKNGYVTTVIFPDGIRPLRGAAFHNARWDISNIGSARFESQ